MQPIVERRREPGFDPLSVGSDPLLLAKIRAEIASSGPMTFARFMALALADPERGYYATAANRPSRTGDFLTAPELHPIFGWTLARTVEETWQLLDRPDPFVLHEFGAGGGSLAEAILEGLARDGSGVRDVLRYVPHDVSPAREVEAVERLRAAGFEAAVGPVRHDGGDGLAIANEFLDALPVHRLRMEAGRLRERYVVVEGDALGEALGDPSTELLAQRLAAEGIELVDGQEVEICLELDGWADRVAAGLGRGIVLVIDYGAPAAELYDPTVRPQGTALAYARHHAHAALLANVGRQDLTAHVDLTAVEGALGRHDFTILGRTTQAAFLVGSGLEAVVERLRSDAETDVAAWTLARSSIARLLDPRALGGFAVVGFGRGLPDGASLRGLRTNVPGRPPLRR